MSCANGVAINGIYQIGREGWRMAEPAAGGCSGLPKARTRRVFFDRSDQPGTPFRVRQPFPILFALFPPRRASA